tara:strand:+ start:570 stop:1496 length:927 start_codon:yes stop_codon:yes gene_type:complete
MKKESLFSWKEFLLESRKVDLSGFKIRSSLNEKFWSNKKLFPEIRNRLITIAEEFFDNLGLEGVELKDITFTGSLANYNWSRYSDIDLHLKVNFSEVDENHSLVREFFRAKTSNWNKSHQIKIFGFEVELYVEDMSETHISTAIYSVKNDQWIAEPDYVNPKIDFDDVKIKANSIMDQIERVHDLFDDEEYEEASKYGIKLKEKIRNFRRSGLMSGGQYSTENLVFKVLRRNGYLGDLFDLVRKSYDSMLSLNGNYEKKMKIFMKKRKDPINIGFNAIKERDKYIKRRKKSSKRKKGRKLILGDSFFD